MVFKAYGSSLSMVKDQNWYFEDPNLPLAEQYLIF